MMQEWYVFRGDHHNGPYAADEIAHFFKQKNIDADTMLWKKGLDAWRPLRHLGDFHQLLIPSGEVPTTSVEKLAEEVPPPLPGLKAKKMILTSELFEERQAEFQVDLDSIILPNLQDLVEERPNTQQATEKATEQSIRTAALQNTSVPQFAILPTLLGLLGMIGLSLPVFLLFYPDRSLENRAPVFLQLMPADSARLKAAWARPKEQKWEVQMAASFPTKSIWLANNRIEFGEANLVLESLSGQVLSQEKKIILKSKASVKQYVAHFREFELAKGVTWAEGKYKAQVQFIAQDKKTTTHEMEILFSNKDQAVLLQEIQTLHAAQHQAQLDQQVELIEKKRTLLALTEIVNRHLKELASKEAKGLKGANTFKQVFAQEVAPILNELLLGAQSDALKDSSLAQDILFFGELTSEAISQINGHKSILELKKWANTHWQRSFDFQKKLQADLASLPL